MNLLGIETATTHASVALTIAGKMYTAEEDTLKKHAEWVLDAIAGLLTQAGVALSDLDGIAFDAGPGSFTGLRIACAVAKGLAMGASLPVYPVSSVRAIAWGVRPHTPVLAVVDARMNAWYWGYFEEMQQMGETQVSAPQAITVPRDVSTGDAGLWLAGVGFEALQADLPQAIQSCLLGTQVVYPTAANILQVVSAGGIEKVSPAEATPIYIRQQVTQQGGSHG
ncbi:MAG: tRNA (adenosine(37)-N6)-threonylcarbamoyltransferase complex dimerization subunit type 1 TsaB [Gammaproteobacteria bacterium]|nr:tRNA (adenosine(37)-N6)-threonylcarbamoyltransferase complex dimerization subunit type 1 TsaB [Gammaproteobacteria bacterium]